MNVWVFRRGEWESRPAPQNRPPEGLGLANASRALTADGSVNLYFGTDSSEFAYGVALRLADCAPQEWICLPDLPSLLELLHLLAPWLRGEGSVRSFIDAALDERLGPPPDQPAGTGSARALTAMNRILFDDAALTADMNQAVDLLDQGAPGASSLIETALRDLTAIRSQITIEGDPTATRVDAVIALLQSSTLLMQAGEQEGAATEIRNALAAWRLEESNPPQP